MLWSILFFLPPDFWNDDIFQKYDNTIGIYIQNWDVRVRWAQRIKMRRENLQSIHDLIEEKSLVSFDEFWFILKRKKSFPLLEKSNLSLKKVQNPPQSSQKSLKRKWNNDVCIIPSCKFDFCVQVKIEINYENSLSYF